MKPETFPESSDALESFASAAELDFAELVELAEILAAKSKALGAVLRIRPQTSGYLDGRARLLADTANELRGESDVFASWLRGEKRETAGVIPIVRTTPIEEAV